MQSDLSDLEEYWKDIRPGRQPEKPKAVVKKFPTLTTPPSPGILRGYHYLQGVSPAIPRFTWSWE